MAAHGYRAQLDSRGSRGSNRTVVLSSYRAHNRLYIFSGIGNVRLFRTAPRIWTLEDRRLAAAICAAFFRVASASTIKIRPSLTCPSAIASAYRVNGGASIITKSNSSRSSANLVFSCTELNSLGESAASEPEERSHSMSCPMGLAKERIGPSCNRASVRP